MLLVCGDICQLLPSFQTLFGVIEPQHLSKRRVSSFIHIFGKFHFLARHRSTFHFNQLSPHLHHELACIIYRHIKFCVLVNEKLVFVVVFGNGLFSRTQKVSMPSQPEVLNPDQLQAATLIRL